MCAPRQLSETAALPLLLLLLVHVSNLLLIGRIFEANMAMPYTGGSNSIRQCILCYNYLRAYNTRSCHLMMYIIPCFWTM